MKKNQIKIGAPYITAPNAIGEIVRETPTQWVVKIIKRTFEPKSSKTLTHKFSKSDREWHNEGFVPFERKFRKTTGRQVGGDWFIVNHELLTGKL